MRKKAYDENERFADRPSAVVNVENIEMYNGRIDDEYMIIESQWNHE